MRKMKRFMAFSLCFILVLSLSLGCGLEAFAANFVSDGDDWGYKLENKITANVTVKTPDGTVVEGAKVRMKIRLGAFGHYKYETVEGTVDSKDGVVSFGINGRWNRILSYTVTYESYSKEYSCDDSIGVLYHSVRNYSTQNASNAFDPTFTVKFVDESNNQIGESKTVAYGTAAVAPEAPKKEGYTFVGWDTSFENVTKDLTIKAQYKRNSYQVSFIDTNGEKIKTVMVDYNEKVKNTDIPELDKIDDYRVTWKVDPTTTVITEDTVFEMEKKQYRFDANYYVLKSGIDMPSDNTNMSSESFRFLGKGKIVEAEDGTLSVDVAPEFEDAANVTWYSIKNVKGVYHVDGYASEYQEVKANFYVLNEGLEVPDEVHSYPSYYYTKVGLGKVLAGDDTKNPKEIQERMIEVPEITNLSLKPNQYIEWYVVKRYSDGWHVDGVIRERNYSVTYEVHPEFRDKYTLSENGEVSLRTTYGVHEAITTFATWLQDSSSLINKDVVMTLANDVTGIDGTTYAKGTVISVRDENGVKVNTDTEGDGLGFGTTYFSENTNIVIYVSPYMEPEEGNKPEDNNPEDNNPEDSKPEDSKPEDTKPENEKPGENTEGDIVIDDPTAPEDSTGNENTSKDQKEDANQEDTNVVGGEDNPAETPDTLPQTGTTDVNLYYILGLGLLACGYVMIKVGRKKKA